MTDYKATTDQWAYQEHWAQEDGDAACILELRARVEALEANTKQWRSDRLRLANTCAGMAEDRLEFFGKLLPDDQSDPEGEIVDYCNALAAQHAGKAVFHQDLSLLQCVCSILEEHHVVGAVEKSWEPQARAVMLEIAKWLESRAGGTRACWLLEREAQR
jgi:hypothetical protein